MGTRVTGHLCYGDKDGACDGCPGLCRYRHPRVVEPRAHSADDAGTKDDAGKPRMDLLPIAGLVEVAHVLTFGAEKYGAHNWHGLSVSRLFGASLRHLWAWWLREDNDPETGRPHLAHAACCVLMALEQTLHRGEYDDRP